MTRARDIYRAIMIAATNGRGLHLTADEVFDLTLDDAIATRAANSIPDKDWPKYTADSDKYWRRQLPTIQAEPANLAGYHRDDPDSLR